MTEEEVKFNCIMLNRLKTYFGYDTFRPLQEEIIQTVLQKKDVLVLMPTGGGKSLCYQLPALAMEGITLVVSPLIALMKDQVDALTANGVESAFINSSLTPQEVFDVQTRAQNGTLKILYVAPERLALYDFQQFLKQLTVSLIAIDEAHCISEWGHDFRPEYRNLKGLRASFPNVPVIALTATATTEVRDDILAQLNMESAPVFLSSFNRPNLHYTVEPKDQTFTRLLKRLTDYKDKAVILYCFSRKDTESLAEDLCHEGFSALPYHAGLNRELRKTTQEKFIRDEVPIIVATIAFGMGIDKPDVRLVAHMDLPKSIEGYYQETGRAGRDGLPSECVLFYSFGDKRKQDYFIGQIQDDRERALAQEKLGRVVDYCEQSACRRRFLLEYFGEKTEGSTCQGCDNCTKPKQEDTDATEIAQKILSAVLKTEERFGMAYVCDVLHGSKKKRVIENGHENLSVFGLAKSVPMDQLRTHTMSLIQKGYLIKNSGDYPTLSVSALGKNTLRDRTAILLPKQEHVLLPLAKGEVGRGSITGASAASDPTLFTQLRTLRKSIADEHNVPPFVVFGDRTLHEMATYFPQSIQSLGSIFGVGKTKLEQFGNQFLTCIKSYAQEHQLTEKPMQRKIERRSLTTVSRPSSTFQKTKELIDQKYSIARIATNRSLSEGTIIGHIIKLLSEGERMDITYLQPTGERFEMIKQAFQTANTNMLSPVKTLLGDEYSYEEIRFARLFF